MGCISIAVLAPYLHDLPSLVVQHFLLIITFGAQWINMTKSHTLLFVILASAMAVDSVHVAFTYILCCG